MTFRECAALVISPASTYTLLHLGPRIDLPFVNPLALFAIAPIIPYYIIAVTLVVFLPLHLWLKRKGHAGLITYLCAGCAAGAAPAFLLGPPWSQGVWGVSLTGLPFGFVAAGIFWLIAVPKKVAQAG